MNRILMMLGILVITLAFAAGMAEAQCCAPAPAVVYSAPAPVVTYYAAPVAACPAPAVTYAAPVVTYRPVAVAPVYRAGYPVAVAPAVVARPVVIGTDVYVPGQPIRNLLRAITPY